MGSEGHVVGLVLALVDAAFDKKLDVRADITRALHNLGRKQPELVLNQCNMYLNRHQKLAQGHRVLLLEIMIKIVKDAGSNLSLDLCKELITLASSELTKSKEIITEWQTAASNLLVVLGNYYSQEVMAEMLQKIVPGTLPHYFVINTLANLAKENVFGVVPFLKDIFSRILPMLGLAKLDNIRWALSTCIGAFSEAILDYCANIENAPFPDISKDRFCGEIFTAFEIMFTVWLSSSKEAKTRLAVVEALGHMSLLMSMEKLDEHIHRLLVGITALYKRHNEHYVITQSLCMVLGAAVNEGSEMLLTTLDQMMNGLHLQACIEPDYNNIQSVKNNNELMRCFQVLTPCFSEKVINFLQLKLEAGNEKSRAATLSILKHLINSCDAYLADKKEIILSMMSILLQENNLRVCQSFSKCVVAMAHHDYLHLEGGEKLIQFILRMCSLTEEDRLTRRVIESDTATLTSVKAMCQNLLHLLSTTVEAIDDVLWPYLLEFLLPAEYTLAVMTLCRSLSNIAARKHEEEYGTLVNLQVFVNVPKGQALFARLIVLTGCPLKDSGRGIHILTFLKWYSPNIHANIVKMWETVVPKLIVYLEENSDDDENWNQKAWEDLILKLLAKTLSEIDSEEWFLQLGKEIGLQLPLYVGDADEKNFLYKCLGVLLRKIGTTDFISEYLNVIFEDIDHTNQVEREGCAMGLGFCAASHLDQCLRKLEEVTKTQMVRKATGFMGLMKDKTEADVERIKSTVVLCYGYVVFYGPPSLVSSRLDSNVMRVINPYLTSIRDSNVKLNVIRAIELIGRALQPSHIQDEEFVFNRKAELLKHLQNFLCAEPKNVPTETRSIIVNAITNFVMLDPPLEEDEIKELVEVCTSNIYPVTSTPAGPGSKLREGQSVSGSNDQSEKFSANALDSINQLLKQISTRDHSPNSLQCVLKYIESYMTSEHDYERVRVMVTIKVVLQNNLETTNFSGGRHFTTLGYILGRLLPRCTDSVTAVRQDSMECVQILLTINDRYEGVPANINDERIQALAGLRVNLSKSDPAVLFNVVNELSVVVSKKTPDGQVRTLVSSLTDGLNDGQKQSSSGACAILNCLLKFRGAELVDEVPSIVQKIVENLESVAFTQTITGSLVALRTLATHHLVKVVQAFLDFPIPLKPNVCEFWKTLAKDKDLLVDTFDHLLSLLQRLPPYSSQEESHRDGPASISVANPQTVAIAAAFTEIFKVPESELLINTMFPKLLSSILMQMGSSLGLTWIADTPKDPKSKKKENASPTPSISPAQLSMNLFKEFINHSKVLFIKHAIDDADGWNLFDEEETFASGLQMIVVAICEHQPSAVNDFVSSLIPTLASTFDAQRMVAMAIFAELINQRCCGDSQLVELLMNSLLAKLVDPSHVVRKLCIRGLGNVSSVGGQKLQTYSTTILSAMMAGMDDKEDPEMMITLEAMSGLTKILGLLDEPAVRQILINICLRIRPCFEKENAEVRAAAILLFGNLSRFGEGPSEASFLEQIHTNFVSILLHLNEEEVVTKSCKVALRMMGPLLGSPAINAMFQKHLIEDGNLHYGEFMNNLSRLIITDYLDKMNFYVMGCVNFFKSSWSDIRGNAALFVGFLLGNMKKDQRTDISEDHICSALVVLLKDPAPNVRSHAAEAISLLHDY